MLWSIARSQAPLRARCTSHRSRSLIRCLQGPLPEDETDYKKQRRSNRLSPGPHDKTPIVNKQHLPSPVTYNNDESSDPQQESIITPPLRRPDQTTPKKTDDNFSQVLSSPPQDTQPLSQFVDRHPAISDDIEDEVREGVWGYLVPLDPKYGDKPLVLKKRSACPMTESVGDVVIGEGKSAKNTPVLQDEETYEKSKAKNASSGGYLIGRHPECGQYYPSRDCPF